MTTHYKRTVLPRNSSDKARPYSYEIFEIFLRNLNISLWLESPASSQVMAAQSRGEVAANHNMLAHGGLAQDSQCYSDCISRAQLLVGISLICNHAKFLEHLLTIPFLYLDSIAPLNSCIYQNNPLRPLFPHPITL